MNIVGDGRDVDFLKKRVGVFQEFPDERLQQLVNGSRNISFEENEAIAHEGAEATHFGVVLNGVVAASIGVYQKDLGPDTAKFARKITTYDPDSSWRPSAD